MKHKDNKFLTDFNCALVKGEPNAIKEVIKENYEYFRKYILTPGSIFHSTECHFTNPLIRKNQESTLKKDLESIAVIFGTMIEFCESKKDKYILFTQTISGLCKHYRMYDICENFISLDKDLPRLLKVALPIIVAQTNNLEKQEEPESIKLINYCLKEKIIDERFINKLKNSFEFKNEEQQIELLNYCLREKIIDEKENLDKMKGLFCFKNSQIKKRDSLPVSVATNEEKDVIDSLYDKAEIFIKERPNQGPTPHNVTAIISKYTNHSR